MTIEEAVKDGWSQRDIMRTFHMSDDRLKDMFPDHDWTQEFPVQSFNKYWKQAKKVWNISKWAA